MKHFTQRGKKTACFNSKKQLKALGVSIAFALMLGGGSFLMPNPAFAADANTALEIGTNSIAEGDGAISTGKNSIAIGTNAVATGDNLTKEKIEAILADNETQLQKIADLKAQIADDEEDFNSKYAIYLQVQQAEAQIEENNAKIAELTPQLTAAQTALDEFQPTYNAAVADMNDRLAMISELDFTLASSDEGLDELAATLKAKTEEGHSFSLDQSFYKQYIQNYITATADLREATNYSSSHTNNDSQSSVSRAIIMDSESGESQKVYPALFFNGNNYTPQYSFGEFSSVTPTQSKYAAKIPSISFYNTSDSTHTYSRLYFSTNTYIIVPLDENLNYVYSDTLSESEYTSKLSTLDSDYSNLQSFVNSYNNEWCSPEAKDQMLDALKYRYELAKLCLEDQYLQGVYESSSSEDKLVALNNRKQVDNQIAQKISEWNSTYSGQKIVYAQDYLTWYEENITNPINANTTSKTTLQAEFEKELAKMEEQYNTLSTNIKNIQSQIDTLEKKNAQLEPTAEQRAEADKAEAAKQKLEADKATLEQAMNELSLMDLTDVGENAIAMGTDSLVTGKNAVGIGTNVIVTGEDSVGIGKGTVITGKSSVAVGPGNMISGDNASVVGTNNSVTGDNNSVMGSNNFAKSDKGIVIGDTSSILDGSDNAIAIGNNIVVNGMPDSVTIGNNSKAKAASAVTSATIRDTEYTFAGSSPSSTFSVGSEGNERQVVNVAAGTISETSTDAINGSQAYALMTAIEDIKATNGNMVTLDDEDSTYATVSSETNDETGAITYTVDVKVDGAIEKDNTGIVTGGTVYAALGEAKDGEYISKDKTINENLSALDTEVQNKADKDFSNITEDGKTIIKNISKDAVKVAAGTNVTVDSAEDATTGTITYTINAKADGKSEEGNTGIISGDTLYQTINNLSSDMEEELAKKADVDAGNLTGHEADWGKAIGTGKIAENNSELVTGGTVYNTIGAGTDGNYIQAKNTVNKNLEILDSEIGEAKTGEYIKGTNTINENLSALDTEVQNKADKDLSNITEDGKTIIKNISKDAVKVAAGTNITVDSAEDTEGVMTYTVNAKADGKSEEGNTGLISGDTLYQTVNNITIDVDNELNQKANIDASNLSGHEADWGKAIGTGKIEQGNSELVTGGTVYNTIGESKDGNYTKAESTVNENISALDNSVYQLGQNTDSRFAQTEQHINEAGAHAAALAALHPQDFDPEDRLSVAAGYGHYRGAGANAIGVFYQPTEDCVISAGRTFGGGHDMWNAGVSFKFGRGNSVNTMSKTQLTKQIVAQNKALDEANAKIETLEAQNASYAEAMAKMQAQIDELMAAKDK